MSFSVFLGVVQIIIQVIAIQYAYSIYRYNRTNKAWLSVIGALLLMMLRRVTVLLIELNLFPPLSGVIQFTDRFILPFLISCLLCLGLWSMKNNFENFSFIREEVSRKVQGLRRRKN